MLSNLNKSVSEVCINPKFATSNTVCIKFSFSFNGIVTVFSFMPLSRACSLRNVASDIVTLRNSSPTVGLMTTVLFPKIIDITKYEMLKHYDRWTEYLPTDDNISIAAG